MSPFYSDQHRTLQDRFDTRRLADLLEEAIVHDAFTPQDQAFIESRDMFFLSTLGADGCPTVSYKGGAPGFVKVDAGVLVFPCYDGNGMFYSMGNVARFPQVGLLFIDFEKPHRLRVQGTAVIGESDALLAAYPGALFLVRVTPAHIFVNCGRYIHPYQRLGQSKHVPKADGSAPLAAWKRIDIVQDHLPSVDQGRAAQVGGTITVEEYEAKVAAGES